MIKVSHCANDLMSINVNSVDYRAFLSESLNFLLCWWLWRGVVGAVHPLFKSFDANRTVCGDSLGLIGMGHFLIHWRRDLSFRRVTPHRYGRTFLSLNTLMDGKH